MYNAVNHTCTYYGQLTAVNCCPLNKDCVTDGCITGFWKLCGQVNVIYANYLKLISKVGHVECDSAFHSMPAASVWDIEGPFMALLYSSVPRGKVR